MRKSGIITRFSTLIKFGLGLIFLFIAFWQVDWQVLKQALKHITWAWFLLATISVLVSLTLKVLRWRMLLKYHQINISLKQTISAYFIGAAVNIVLFIRGGEIIRIGWAHQPQKDDIANITATIGLEKYFDLIMLSFSLLTMSAILPSIAVDQWARLSPLLVVLSALLLIAALFGPLIWKRFNKPDGNKGLKSRVSRQIDLLMDAIQWLRSPGKLISIIAISVFIWLVMLSTNMFLFQALKLPSNWKAAGLVLVLVYIGVLPALMPGNIGPFTYFAQLALIPFSINSTQALAFAILLFAIVTLPPLIIAGFSLLTPGTIPLLGKIHRIDQDDK